MYTQMITLVGTSLLDNFCACYDQYLKDYGIEKDNSVWNKLKSGNEELNEDEIGILLENIEGWVFGVQCPQWDSTEKVVKQTEDDSTLNQFASAEITSIYRLIETGKYSDIRVVLLATDTSASHACCTLIKTFLGDGETITVEDVQITVSYEKSDRIEGLSLDDYDVFRKSGISNLAQSIKRMKDLSYDNYLCLSGGYKGIVPVATMIAQLLNIKLCYVHEDSTQLIEMPMLPVSVNLTEKEKEFLRWIAGEEMVDISEVPHSFKEIADKLKEYPALDILIDQEDNLLWVNDLGIIINKLSEKME